MQKTLFKELQYLIRCSNTPFCATQLLRKSHGSRPHHRRRFGTSKRLDVVKPYLLADIGEGITECQVIQWFVQPGARVEQFDKICEVQSDKASVEITSRFDGVIKKLYYEADDMAKVGKPLVDIDIQSEISPEDEALTKVPGEAEEKKLTPDIEEQSQSASSIPDGGTEEGGLAAEGGIADTPTSQSEKSKPSGKHKSLATPAVRHLVKELSLDITDIPGTGKDGRVLKEDVQKFSTPKTESTAGAPSQTSPQPSSSASTTSSPRPVGEPLTTDKTVPLTPIQSQMFKTMTRSLSIPHFLYTDSVDMTSINTLRNKLNRNPKSAKLSALPFILKALSLALSHHPLLNAHLNTADSKPHLHLKALHNIGVAMDTPSGLLVPVIRAVQSHTIASLATELSRLSSLARAGKLTAADLSGATVSVSNIGSIGGGAVAPVIVPPQVAILGVGRAKAVPRFDGEGKVVRAEEAVFSWSADHRVIDGAVVARCAERVKGYLEGVEGMVLEMS
ncbi:hypothetical protein M501DRAFT_926861 [Patellaria atrata CBS 101060]|uniref:Dihydrolipoamide acetyltransferase component of pyruvate dehydrogenase complex n=1 Tax=Patellaria atrata CBS 101060 TaxID=1346257 RepID=A0A9P4SH49_9PEZI|nr:hypothetical protein M501DRAFT_926861 [Patellaria atrata CBS 101060]